jgi:hypothetical protein
MLTPACPTHRSHGRSRLAKATDTGDVAVVIEISARSPISFEEAIKTGVERATHTLRG